MSRYSYDDPPDYPEPPECCDDLMDVLDDGSLHCPRCGKTIAPAPDDFPDPGPDDDGLPLEACFDPCLPDPPRTNRQEFDEDLAFDAARERRHFGRR